jgi:hypothetical protein
MVFGHNIVRLAAAAGSKFDQDCLRSPPEPGPAGLPADVGAFKNLKATVPASLTRDGGFGTNESRSLPAYPRFTVAE